MVKYWLGFVVTLFPNAFNVGGGESKILILTSSLRSKRTRFKYTTLLYYQIHIATSFSVFQLFKHASKAVYVALFELLLSLKILQIFHIAKLYLLKAFLQAKLY